jgi:predicted ABC-type ATPase
VPDLIIIAGPNGAGKTTFAREYLSKEGLRFEFVNADEIARSLALEGDAQGHSSIRAGRVMLARIDALVSQGVDLAIETTLATLTYAPKILGWLVNHWYMWESREGTFVPVNSSEQS